MSNQTEAKYWPPKDVWLARISVGGDIVAIFKKPPTDAQGDAMAKAMSATAPKPDNEAMLAALVSLLRRSAAGEGQDPIAWWNERALLLMGAIPDRKD